MKDNAKTYFLLHLLLMMYSAGGILSKLAARETFLSGNFVLLYAGVVAVLAVYAVGWQQVLKRIDLSAAYANKAVTVVWGCVWGLLVFREHLTAGKAIGAALVLCGIVLYGLADGKAGARDE